MEPFKNLYNKNSLGQLAKEIKKSYPKFDDKAFLKSSLKNFPKLEMKERVVQISSELHNFLPGPYKKNISLLIKTLKSQKNPEGLEGFILWPYSHYIETYGLEDFKTSMTALYEVTQRFTSEFGIRAFIEKDPKAVYELLENWVNDSNEHVRRLVSEGTRPNLPWGKKISHMEKLLKKNISLLNALKDDSSEYVRKSVANHMNDITWIDDQLALKSLKKWNKSSSKELQWICKHALRSLLKQGRPEALELLGFSHKSRAQVKDLKLSKKTIKEGDHFDLSFSLKNQESKTTQYMVDYIIFYPKANGQLSPKTFKLKNLKLDKNQTSDIVKKIHFKKVTTRKHYKGVHELHIQVNGKVRAKTQFRLQ
ncbi:MAG: DNA alkylation repair protein [Bdellovibrionales bacterium]|nr:DNA alkylation repair protein [Bdellovibrionales bacterium]NQZ17956.1 DNA alkylation repair protein [Bdellovibrionales bacterium]